MNLDKIIEAIRKCCEPRRVILYGEKVTAGKHDLKSLDLCVIIDHCDNNKLTRELYLKVKAPIPIQFVLYTSEDWSRLKANPLSHAAVIEKKGTVLYGETSKRE